MKIWMTEHFLWCVGDWLNWRRTMGYCRRFGIYLKDPPHILPCNFRTMVRYQGKHLYYRWLCYTTPELEQDIRYVFRIPDMDIFPVNVGYYRERMIQFHSLFLKILELSTNPNFTQIFSDVVIFTLCSFKN